MQRHHGARPPPITKRAARESREADELRRTVEELQAALLVEKEHHIRALRAASQQAAQVRTRDDIIATLYSVLADRDDTLTEATRVVRQLQRRDAAETPPTTAVCECCFAQTPVALAVRCDAAARHVFCVRCVDRLALERRSRPCAEVAGHLPCPSTHACAGTLAAESLFRAPNGRKLVAEHHVHEAGAHVLEAARACELSGGDGEGLCGFALRLAMLRHDGSFRGYMCPRCHCGPLWHVDCTDLRAHHRQAVADGEIDNACPECGYFAEDVSLLQPWDGRRHATVRQDHPPEERGEVPHTCPPSLSSDTAEVGPLAPRAILAPERDGGIARERIRADAAPTAPVVV